MNCYYEAAEMFGWKYGDYGPAYMNGSYVWIKLLPTTFMIAMCSADVVDYEYDNSRKDFS